MTTPDTAWAKEKLAALVARLERLTALGVVL